MHFISPQADTLALADLKLVKFVAIGNIKFYYNPENKKFGEEVADFNCIKLLITHKFEPSGREKGVAYDQYSSISSTNNYATYADKGQILQLNLNEYFVYAKKLNYFLADQNNRFYPATKNSILKLYAKNKTAVAKYMKNNRIDLQKEDDLKKLLSYCSQLTS